LVNKISKLKLDTTLQVLPSDVPIGGEASYAFTNESDERLLNFLNFLKSKDSDTSSAVIGILCNCTHYSYFAKRLNKLSEEDEIVSTLIGRLTGSSQKTKIDALKTLTNICNQNFTPYADLICSFSNGTPKNILDLYFTDKNAPKYILDMYCLIFDYLYKESREIDDGEQEVDQNAEKIAAMMLDKNSGLKKLQELFPLILNDEFQTNIQNLLGVLTAEEFLREDLRKQFQKVAKESEEKALEVIKKKQQEESKKEKEREMMMMQMMQGFGGM
jgi:hypothetical protein